MSDHVIAPAWTGLIYFISIINQFAHYPFPGTDIPIGILMLSPAVVWFIWRKVTVWLFGGELH